jgi:hypothetical protein
MTNTAFPRLIVSLITVGVSLGALFLAEVSLTVSVPVSVAVGAVTFAVLSLATRRSTTHPHVLGYLFVLLALLFLVQSVFSWAGGTEFPLYMLTLPAAVLMVVGALVSFRSSAAARR